MKRIVLLACLLVGFTSSVSAQRDDLYFVPKKKRVVQEVSAYRTSSQRENLQTEEETETFTMATVPAKQLEMDEDAYNRRGAYRIEQDDDIEAKSIVVITEEGDTMWMDTDTLRLTRAVKDEGWINGFEGSDSDYEYAMRIVRFRNPRYAIPVSSPLYWDVVYGGALWPSWDWNVYDDGMYAYVFPASTNRFYWDYMMSYPFGWSVWSNPWTHYHGSHWGLHWGGHYGFYGYVGYDPWYSPYFHGYHPGWYHGPHHTMHPGMGPGKPGWNKPKAYPNHRTAATASTRRIDNGSGRNSSVSSRTSGDQVIRRSTGSSSVSRSTATEGSSRTTSRTSYDRPSSTRSSSSSVSRSSNSRSSSSSVSRSSSSSSNRSSSSSSRSSNYSSSSSSSSRSSSSFSSGGSSRSSSYSSGSSRGGSSYSGGSSSRSSGGRR